MESDAPIAAIRATKTRKAAASIARLVRGSILSSLGADFAAPAFDAAEGSLSSSVAEGASSPPPAPDVFAKEDASTTSLASKIGTSRRTGGASTSPAASLPPSDVVVIIEGQ